MQYFKVSLLFFLLFILLYQCSSLLGAGTHGSVKAYTYPVRKEKLQQVVEKVIADDFYIMMADTSHKGYIIDITNGANDTLTSPYAKEDAERYLEFTITKDNLCNRYTIQYVGSMEDWQKDSSTTLSIAYAYDKDDNGGSEGNGGFPWYKPFLKKRITTLFEEEFLTKIDKQLGVTYNIEK